MTDFVHLHNHSEYSLLDGACRIKELVHKAVEFEMPAVAITDHGNMFGVVDFYNEAINNGVKPIIGQECYIAPESMNFKKKVDGVPSGGYHLVLLVKDKVGYKNLLKISSAGYLRGFYYKPRVDKEYLREHSEGLIALSGCVKGEISSKIIDGQYGKAKAVAREYMDIFGADNFYIELQDHGIADEKRALEGLVRLSKELGIKTVLTNDAHYINPEDVDFHDVLLCVQTKSKIADENRLRFNSDQMYFKSPEEMQDIVPDVPEAYTNTKEIADKCHFEMEMSGYKMPKIDVPDEYDDVDSYLKSEVLKGIERRYREVNDELQARVAHELAVIKELGFSDYFIIVADFTKFARNKGIRVGPGRGSAAGSVVSYALGITDIEPLEHDLIFERFLNPERHTMPDIDMDFEDTRRDEIIQYVKNKYGTYSVCQIITFGTMAARAAVKDVCRVYDIDFSDSNSIAQMIPPGASIDNALDNVGDLRRAVESKEIYRKVFAAAQKLEGLPRHASVHAAGVVIAPEKLMNFVPLYKTNKDDITTQFDMNNLKKVGLLKMDFLGLKTLTIISNALEFIKRSTGEGLDIDSIPLDDKKTFELLSQGRTNGIFQFESDGMKKNMRKLKPDSLNDMITLNALYRPGPMEMIDEYIARKHGQKEIKYDHPLLEPILKSTYGIIIFQEQVMKIAQEAAGFSMGDADLLRRAMGDKDDVLMSQKKEQFVSGALENDVPERTATDIFNLIARFAEYGFNKSHSVAYAYLAYQTSYLKAHYPTEFLTANLTANLSDSDRIALFLDEAESYEIKVLHPDVNRSYNGFSIEEGEIRIGLGAVKNVGSTAVESIVDAREALGKPFENIFEFCEAVDLGKVNSRAMEQLIVSGAMDSFDGSRAQLVAGLDNARNWGTRQQENKLKGQVSLFEDVEDDSLQTFPSLPDVKPWPLNSCLVKEKESLGFYLSGHPLQQYAEEIKAFTDVTSETLSSQNARATIRIAGKLREVNKVRTKKKNREMAYGLLEDFQGIVRFVIFPKNFKKNSEYIEEGRMLWIKGQVSYEDDQQQPQVSIEEVLPLEQARKVLSSFLHLRMHQSEIDKSDLHKLKRYLLDHKGDVPLALHVLKEEKTYRAESKEFSSDVSEALCKKLGEILGRENVWIT